MLEYLNHIKLNKVTLLFYYFRVPKDICFGQGVSRGFLGGRGRGRGKHSKKKHWYNKDQNMDTCVDIEKVDMTELSTALD